MVVQKLHSGPVLAGVKRKVLLTHCLEFDEERSMEAIVKEGAEVRVWLNESLRVSFRFKLPAEQSVNE